MRRRHPIVNAGRLPSDPAELLPSKVYEFEDFGRFRVFGNGIVQRLSVIRGRTHARYLPVASLTSRRVRALAREAEGRSDAC